VAQATPLISRPLEFPRGAAFSVQFTFVICYKKFRPDIFVLPSPIKSDVVFCSCAHDADQVIQSRV
jgi:hypothetical protein